MFRKLLAFSRQMERNYPMEFILMTNSYEYWIPMALHHYLMRPVNDSRENQF